MIISGPDVPTLHDRNFVQRPDPLPNFRLDAILQGRDMPIVARQDSSSTTSSSDPATTSCGPKDTTGPCERMVAANPNTTTIPVVLGVAVPLSVAFVILIILHRRHVKRLRREDAEDKHKSLDFGMDGAVVTEKRKRKTGPNRHSEMSTADAHNAMRRDRGMSMDLALTNPYLLPPEVQHSRESLHSLSRSIHTGDDKYRNTTFVPDDGSLRSPSSLHHHDAASIYTYSSRHRTDADSVKGLLPSSHSTYNESVPIIKKPVPVARENSKLRAASSRTDGSADSSPSSNNHSTTVADVDDSYLEQPLNRTPTDKNQENIQYKPMVAELDSHSVRGAIHEAPPATFQNRSSRSNNIPAHDAGFEFNIPPNTYELSSGHESKSSHTDIVSARQVTNEIYEAPGHDVQSVKQPQIMVTSEPEPASQHAMSQHRSQQEDTTDLNIISQYEDISDYYDEAEEEDDDTYDIHSYNDLGYDPRLLTMGMRPLPPDDPSENPEQRANRIRSFYKEYFDDTAKPGGEKARLSYFDGSKNYVDDYYGSHDRPRYNHGSQAYGHYGHGPRAPSTMSARGPPGRHRATVSNGSFLYGGPGPRAHSSASQRLPGSKPRGGPKKKLPPPAPLQVLPTPSMLKDDSMLPNPLDYAPPQMFKNQRAGTPDSLRGGTRPFSPSARAYNPLVSSFDDLSVLPSPHQLRRSGTFSALDFAPPRFAAPPSGASDSGSIRSNRSGMSAMQLQSIRAGAYRLSRIPKEVAGTREELATALKPQWNAR